MYTIASYTVHVLVTTLHGAQKYNVILNIQ